MVSTENNTSNYIPLPHWHGVRPIYRKLSDEFHILTSTFHITIDPQIKVCLDHLIIAIDEIDTCVDELPTKDERDDMTNSLINYLKDHRKDWSHTHATASLSIKIKNLKKVVHKLNIQDDFIEAAKTIFHFTEIKRHTKKTHHLINYVCLEGQATALLPLAIMGVKNNSPFGVFFTRLCMIMGVADLVIDAKPDYKQGLILLKPTFTLYLKLCNIAIRDGVKLLISIPRKIQFVRYCYRFAIALLKSQS